MNGAKAELMARVAAMTDEQATDALALLDGAELTDEEHDGLLEAANAMDRGEGIDGDIVHAELLALVGDPKRKASGE